MWKAVTSGGGGRGIKGASGVGDIVCVYLGNRYTDARLRLA